MPGGYAVPTLLLPPDPAPAAAPNSCASGRGRGCRVKNRSRQIRQWRMARDCRVRPTAGKYARCGRVPMTLSV